MHYLVLPLQLAGCALLTGAPRDNALCGGEMLAQISIALKLGFALCFDQQLGPVIFFQPSKSKC